MKTPDYNYRASQKYRLSRCRHYTLELSPKDEDLIAWLDKKPNKQGYLRELIRADMEKHQP